ncbi:MAG: cadmium-translocating P-type ATPase [Cytophagaceae bacterium]|nr:cadmium-translocating P-type ATPase [Cytophagaceae bacterium]
MSIDCSSGECSVEEPNNKKSVSEESDGHDHSHGNEESDFKKYLPAIGSFILLITGVALNNFEVKFFNKYFQLFLFGTAYIIIGGPVVLKALKSIPKGNIFNEFFLMSLATIGAFFIGQYAEGVAVMLFYSVGELVQDAAVNRAKRSIKALLEIQSDQVTVLQNGTAIIKHPKEVTVGEIIQIKPGEKVALDGELISEKASFNTSALTGESVPDTKSKGEKVLAGMINLNTLADVKVTSAFSDTKLARILTLVQEAVGRKARTQQFISKFAKVYTPIVVFLAVGLTFLPYFFIENYVFTDWLYRALVFLVISCPCALVISIPLGYFGGIGAASKNGILFKGSNFLDLMTKVDTVVMDKTGTLTKAVFKVQQVKVKEFDQNEFIKLTAALESKSSHPIAKAVTLYAKDISGISINDVEEIAGHGLKGKVNNYEILAGNAKLLKRFNIPYDAEVDSIIESIVVVAINGEYKGFITVADEIKEDALESVQNLHRLGIKKIVMLSGDKNSVTQHIAKKLQIDEAFGGLLPEDKVNKVSALKSEGRIIAFVGDGVNDAPVVALADVGIAMGGLGSDATIETADVVIQTDHPSKIATSVKIGKATTRIVWQNIILAFVVKAIVLALGAGGLATMWEAVFADVGVALLAILNAVRIQKMKF